MDENRASDFANRLAAAEDADILVFNGDIEPSGARAFSTALSKRKRSKNLILVLTTPGGDPNAAFKIGRTIQNCYDKVTIFVPGWCKSAGTLVAIAANRLIVGEKGELGPLDIQIAKSDEIMELGSGLTVDASMKALEQTAQKMFINLLIGIRRDTGGGLTTKTAADIASRMVTGLLEPVFRQIDPIKIGENSRAMNITKGYGNRLNLRSQNLRSPGSLDFLVSAYPDHSFVIDRHEATLLFKCVEEPNEMFTHLEDAMGIEAHIPSPSLAGKDGLPYIKFLSNERVNHGRSEENAPGKKASGTRKSRLRPPAARANGSTAPTAAKGA